ncbi:MAG: glutamate N-acetyltransferase / amino-acid N-acetyltransferase [Candidatus Sumerlaeota bacterium]|nr:glutamate N-acetyltransferase / amino-acid N-acetyltransferase [Candidatus Sumerlaeota bacterium]
MKFPKGFRGGAAAAGLKKSGKKDIGLILSDVPCAGAGVFTRNLFAGANIAVCRRHLAKGTMRGIVVHAGQANACTGTEGEKVAEATAAAVARLIGADPAEFVVGSTGVIGVLPDLGRIEAGLKSIAEAGLSPEGIEDVGRAMMTTDLVPKSAEGTCRMGGKQVRILGLAKGSGMIHPNMGTMLAYILTDARLPRPELRAALRAASDASFNCMTVDGDTSTSDMLVALANGAAGNESISAEELVKFREALTKVCQSLARQVASDGEGATRLVTIRVAKAKSAADAKRAAMAVGTSSLVKTAIFGRDPNWGRIACAVGYSGASFDPKRVSIKLGGTRIFAQGRPVAQDRAALAQYLRDEKEVRMEIELNAGAAEATVWTCDFSYDYVKINAEYTT